MVLSKPLAKIKWTGGKKLAEELRKYRELYPAATTRAIFKEGYAVSRAAKLITPVDESLLLNTQYTTEVKKSDGVGVFEIVYPMAYAVFVHEAPASTKFQRPGAQSKFLEDPLKAAAEGMLRRMADYIRGQIKGGKA